MLAVPGRRRIGRGARTAVESGEERAALGGAEFVEP